MNCLKKVPISPKRVSTNTEGVLNLVLLVLSTLALALESFLRVRESLASFRGQEMLAKGDVDKWLCVGREHCVSEIRRQLLVVATKVEQQSFCR